jgi:glycosyltransferase involved in cell wall biosynthesis
LILIFGRYYPQENLSGSEKFTKRLFEYFPSDKNKICFIDFFFGYSLKNIPDKILGEKLLFKRGNVSFYRMGIIPLVKTILGKNVNAIFITNLEGYALFSVYIRKLVGKVKVFYILHGIYLYELKYDKDNKEKFFFRYKYIFLEKKIIKVSDTIIYLSDESRKLFNNYYKSNGKQSYIIPHGTDKAFFCRKEDFNYNNSLRLVYTGGYGRSLKGFDFLGETLSKLDFPIQLTMCGHIENPDSFYRQLKSVGNIKVDIKGFIDAFELAELYKSQDIFVLPSKFETFSISTIEAMASSLVPVITKNSGAAELIENGVNGFLFEYLNKEELKNILSFLNDNRTKLKYVGSNAHQTVSDLRWDKVALKYYEILSKYNLY